MKRLFFFLTLLATLSLAGCDFFGSDKEGGGGDGDGNGDGGGETYLVDPAYSNHFA